uniref:Uncharacterized protein n=1 Tax=Haptolina brevifila TaxID=156173 RepID=A0A7S2E4D5_9EUKA|eukprot:CAMPEP_0174719372 /NCGR_PEP_ID=MMETSP1094-20130205/30940_1 /TAXON_ID=156173 /ORGANISM="Chrysochromulina brevifilum, Strain UTEX LB 985" /LENGTH=168 /DNA_ID=CAMNT_0015919657 /DNA_START=27 /DNA_END=533 /DNA_ORIENTATION=+
MGESNATDWVELTNEIAVPVGFTIIAILGMYLVSVFGFTTHENYPPAPPIEDEPAAVVAAEEPSTSKSPSPAKKSSSPAKKRSAKSPPKAKEAPSSSKSPARRAKSPAPKASPSKSTPKGSASKAAGKKPAASPSKPRPSPRNELSKLAFSSPGKAFSSVSKRRLSRG